MHFSIKVKNKNSSFNYFCWVQLKLKAEILQSRVKLTRLMCPDSPGLQMHIGVYPWTVFIWNTKPPSTELQQCLVLAWFCVEGGERSWRSFGL